MAGNRVLIKITDLKKSFPGGTEALKGVNLEVYQGELLVIVGSSGAGKSTLLRCINGLTPITSGSIEVDGKQVEKLKGRELRQLRTQVGMIFQSFNIVNRKRVIDNALHGRLAYYGLRGVLGMFSYEDKKKAFDVLARLDLDRQAVKRADQLSGGQKQRVSIARAIMQDPKVLLADEPVASLDPGASSKVLGYLQKICREEGITAIVSLHQVDYARQYADRIIGLTEGLVTFEGMPEDLNDEAVQELYFENGEEEEEL